MIDVALIVHGEHGYSARNLPNAYEDFGGREFYPVGQFVSPFGIGAAPSSYAIAASTHMAKYGTTHEQLAEVAVATRKWASMNPKAYMRDPITIDDVLN